MFLEHRTRVASGARDQALVDEQSAIYVEDNLFKWHSDSFVKAFMGGGKNIGDSSWSLATQVLGFKSVM